MSNQTMSNQTISNQIDKTPETTADTSGTNANSAPIEPKRIVVIGTGYVGLPAAILLADAGHNVTGVDINENIVAAINEGVLHIDEQELQTLMDKPSVRSNLSARHTPCEGDVFIVAVPTPLDERRKIADLAYIVDAVRSIVPVIRSGNLVIIESTVPPMTCRQTVTPILEESGLLVGRDLQLAHCPERILPRRYLSRDCSQ